MTNHLTNSSSSCRHHQGDVENCQSDSNSNSNVTILSVAEIFGQNVFSLKAMSKALPKPVFAAFQEQLAGTRAIDRPTADAIAHAVKVWAMSKGATHFTHWFQPLTGTTAEKHDSFLSLGTGLNIGVPLDSFSGSQLIQAEPDASSFPNGGVRSTFEARGYTIWDTGSPMFVQGDVLYIPSVFISYNGDALDEKTVLMRSCAAVGKATMDLLQVLNKKKRSNDQGVNATKVHVTLGTEQEFFLIDKSLWERRLDLKMTGRTLFGVLPPKHQQMEDHYFGQMPTKVLPMLAEAELELWKLGVPLKTRHNEVAPCQFEVAPVYEEAGLAVDHNLLTMQVLHKAALKHGLRALFHEKPFDGVNGSGKHCNWSLETDQGQNLLDPGSDPLSNEPFLVILGSILLGVAKHASLLRASIASVSNELRLGANEAPPSIISVFLGAMLTAVLDSIIEEGDRGGPSIPNARHTPIQVNLGSIDLHIPRLPTLGTKDNTDRNRTSPLAFTGNKFEFRAVGSKQSPSFPVAMLNVVVAEGMREVAEMLGSNKYSSTKAVLKEIFLKSSAIRFEGDGYSQEWVQSAIDRGLPVIKSAPEAFAQLLKNRSVLVSSQSVMSDSELVGRVHVLVEAFEKTLVIEAGTMVSMARQQVLPALLRHRKDVATGASAVSVATNTSLTQVDAHLLNTLGGLLEKLYHQVTSLEQLKERAEQHMKNGNHGNGHSNDPSALDAINSFAIIDSIKELRETIDQVERVVPDDLWLVPKYNDLLFL